MHLNYYMQGFFKMYFKLTIKGYKGYIVQFKKVKNNKFKSRGWWVN